MTIHIKLTIYKEQEFHFKKCMYTVKVRIFLNPVLRLLRQLFPININSGGCLSVQEGGLCGTKWGGGLNIFFADQRHWNCVNPPRTTTTTPISSTNYNYFQPPPFICSLFSSDDFNFFIGWGHIKNPGFENDDIHPSHRAIHSRVMYNNPVYVLTTTTRVYYIPPPWYIYLCI